MAATLLGMNMLACGVQESDRQDAGSVDARWRETIEARKVREAKPEVSYVIERVAGVTCLVEVKTGWPASCDWADRQ